MEGTILLSRIPGLIAAVGVALVLTLTMVASAEAVPRCRYNSPYACKAKQERSCGKIITWQEGIKAPSRVFARKTGCRTARRVAWRGAYGYPNGRWRVVYGSGEGGVWVKGGSRYQGERLLWRKYVRISSLRR